MNNTKNKRKSILKYMLSFGELILTILTIFVCIIVVVQRVSNNEESFVGYRLFKVETGSMIPKYNINDVILVKEVDINSIEIGDDLVYIGTEGQYKGRIITHQVVEKEIDDGKLEFYTKGIANTAIDPVVSSEQVLGIVQAKCYIITFIIHILLNPYTVYFLIIIPMVINLFFNEIHSKDRREKYIMKKIEERRAEQEKENNKNQQEEIKSLTKRKRGQIIISTKNSRNRKDQR